MYVLMRKNDINIILRAATAFVNRIDCKVCRLVLVMLNNKMTSTSVKGKFIRKEKYTYRQEIILV